MKSNNTIQIKAALLLLVFSLNTLLGFACSLGLNLGYNKHHHKEEVAATSSLMAHHEKGSTHNSHEEKKQSHHQSDSDKDCCGNGVTSFNLLNKTLSHQVELVHPDLFVAIIATRFNSGSLAYINATKNIQWFVQSHHPPIPDIRIAIQSFQI